MMLPYLVHLIATDADFRTQFLVDAATAVTARQVVLTAEEWNGLLELRNALSREPAKQWNRLIQSLEPYTWIGSASFTHAGLSKSAL